MTSISQTIETPVVAPALTATVAHTPSRRRAAWRDLVAGPGPLWWRVLRWSQRARMD